MHDYDYPKPLRNVSARAYVRIIRAITSSAQHVEAGDDGAVWRAARRVGKVQLSLLLDFDELCQCSHKTGQ
jgi:hypothetical protein